MSAELTLLSLAIAVVGGGMVTKPYAHARLSEQIDAIGSTTPLETVEPAEWKVLVTRMIGVLLLVIGVALAYESVTA